MLQHLALTSRLFKVMKHPSENQSQEVLAGLVERVTYHNVENGFCVLRAKARRHRGVVSTLERGREEVSRGKTLIDGPQIESRQALKSTLRPPETVGATFSLSTAVSAEAAAPAARMTILASRYTIELFKPGGEGAGVEAIIDRDDLFNFARALYHRAVMKHPGRLVMLCERARILARSDRPETMPL
jgi:hypothetical protein